MTTDCTPRYCYADPVEGGKQAVAEAYRNLCAVGAKPLAITNCLNFGNPQRPEIMAQIVGCLAGHERGVRRARHADRERERLPLQREQGDGRRQRDPADAGDRRGRVARGLGEERRRLRSRPKARRSCLIGGRQRQPRSASRSGSANRHGRKDGPPPAVDLDKRARAGELRPESDRRRAWSPPSTTSPTAALRVALAEMALAGGIGADADLWRDLNAGCIAVWRGPGALHRRDATIAAVVQMPIERRQRFAVIGTVGG